MIEHDDPKDEGGSFEPPPGDGSPTRDVPDPAERAGEGVPLVRRARRLDRDDGRAPDAGRRAERGESLRDVPERWRVEETEVTAKRADVLDGLLDLLADRVAERVLERLGPGAGEASAYTTARQGPHIPGKSRDWMRRHVRVMPGARKVGRDWVIAKADYDAWAAAQDASRTRPRPPALAKTMDDVDFAETMLAKVGLRVRR